jgi:hypothetical protein
MQDTTCGIPTQLYTTLNMNTKKGIVATFLTVLLLPVIFLWCSPRVPAIAMTGDDSRATDIVNMTSCDAAVVSSMTADLLVVIISDYKNFNKRKYLRSTWATQNDILPAIRFFVGKSNQDSVNNDLEEEAEQFQDVCIMNYADKYATLPLKVCECSIYHLHKTRSYFFSRFCLSLFGHCQFPTSFY